MSYQLVTSDFDGVLHLYSTPWKGPEIIPDDAVPVFTESDYEEDKKAWDEFCKKELFFSFQYIEIVYEMKKVIQ